jgi:hypothetical protein
MRSFGAIAVSFRVAQVHWADIAPQIGVAEQVLVRVLDESGCTQEIQLEVTEGWSGGWGRLFQCPTCRDPARVLSIASSTALCGRCLPRRTKHHAHKNSRAWRDGGDMHDRLIRAVLRKPGAKPTALKRLAQEAAAKTLGRAAATTNLAGALARAINESGLLDQ